jgi:alkanesulfonate monooxygenase SsuD/methylene tetrahydromethanopterin reductase-like flavin-dependent oxidoreductase (luciferase family)
LRRFLAPQLAELIGLAMPVDHDGRYDVADEYMELVYQLWEASWEEGAVLRDKANRVFAYPSKIHRARHAGRQQNPDYRDRHCVSHIG